MDHEIEVQINAVPTSSLSRALQRAAVNQEPVADVPPIVQDVLRDSGEPLAPSTRALMESHLGHDFSQVRVHTDAHAAQSQ